MIIMRFKPFARVLVTAILANFALVTALRAQTLQIVGFGDSLMAGYQLEPQEAFPVQLEKALRDRGHDIVITNAGVSGDTTTGGLARLDWSIPDGTDIVILELGANDALRGLDPQIARDNLFAMVDRLQARNIGVYLAGIYAPPNLGEDYGKRFNTIFPDLATARDIPLYPFFLDGVTGEVGTQLSDAMHPNAHGVAIMVERFLPGFEAFLASVKAGKG
jgi:acyl-CoA thioesterase-1